MDARDCKGGNGVRRRICFYRQKFTQQARQQVRAIMNEMVGRESMPLPSLLIIKLLHVLNLYRHEKAQNKQNCNPKRKKNVG